MSAGRNVILTGIVVGVMSLTAAAAARRPAGQWDFFHFDGHSFVAGRLGDGAPSVALQSGVLPSLVTQGDPPAAVRLARGSGALLGICYLQSSGGKLARGPAYLPVALLPVRIFSGAKLLATTQTDAQGYFLVTLAAGSFRVEAGQAVQVTVEKGMTTLVPLRVGKRMID